MQNKSSDKTPKLQLRTLKQCDNMFMRAITILVLATHQRTAMFARNEVGATV